MSRPFNRHSEKYLKEADPSHRKALGQYFTPQPVRDHLMSRLPDMSKASILDPACGTGEFLLSAREYFKNCQLTGWEIDPALVELVKSAVPTAEIIGCDSLTRQERRLFDCVIGNPPYFEFKPDDKLRAEYADVISGRANIFALFIKRGLDLLKPGGYLGYVVPPSMNNGAYFAGLRDYIVRHANVEYLKILGSAALFHNAQQSVMILILRKGPNKGKYLFSRNGITIFSPNPAKLRRAFRGKTTLKEQGFVVRTGKIVWNQHRDKLSNRPESGVPLVRAHNISDSPELSFDTMKNLQYITTDRFDQGPALVVNRVTGTAGKGYLKAAIIKSGAKFLGENHVNVIYPSGNGSSVKNMKLLERIRTGLISPETAETIRLITGNTQISKTELECLLPLDL